MQVCIPEGCATIAGFGKEQVIMHNRKRYYREVYLELQRVVASNRFIFTQLPIGFTVGCLLGLVPFVVYLMFWLVIMLLGMFFEGPYKILRWLLPYGNWPPALEPSSVGLKIVVLSYTILIVVAISIGMYVELQFLGMPIFEFCSGSAVCSIIEAISQR